MSLGKKDIVKNITLKAHITTDSQKLLEYFLEVIKINSKKKLVKISTFGTFSTRITPERIGRNPKTKEEFLIPKKLKLFFSSSNKVKNILN